MPRYFPLGFQPQTFWPALLCARMAAAVESVNTSDLST